jgi:hypothetical protein
MIIFPRGLTGSKYTIGVSEFLVDDADLRCHLVAPLCTPGEQPAATAHLNRPESGGLRPIGVESILNKTYIRKLKSKFEFPVLGRLPAELGPKTRLTRSGSKNGVERT